MFEFIVSTQAVDGEAAVAVAGTRAGAVGVVDLQFAVDPGLVGVALRRVSEHARGPWGVHVDDIGMLETVLAAEPDGLETVLVSAPTVDELAALIVKAAAQQRRTLAVVTSVAQALAADRSISSSPLCAMPGRHHSHAVPFGGGRSTRPTARKATIRYLLER